MIDTKDNYKIPSDYCNQSKCCLFFLFSPASAVEGIKSVPCVCVSVSWRSHGRTVWRTDPKFSVMIDLVMTLDVMWRHDFMWHHGTTSWRHVTSWYDVMTSQHDVLTSFDDFWARILTKRTRRGRARQRSGVFILIWSRSTHPCPISQWFLGGECHSGSDSVTALWYF